MLTTTGEKSQTREGKTGKQIDKWVMVNSRGGNVWSKGRGVGKPCKKTLGSRMEGKSWQRPSGQGKRVGKGYSRGEGVPYVLKNLGRLGECTPRK